jgi:hypothetical protein
MALSDPPNPATAIHKMVDRDLRDVPYQESGKHARLPDARRKGVASNHLAESQLMRNKIVNVLPAAEDGVVVLWSAP